jgi:hypothetical protein
MRTGRFGTCHRPNTSKAFSITLTLRFACCRSLDTCRFGQNTYPSRAFVRAPCHVPVPIARGPAATSGVRVNRLTCCPRPSARSLQAHVSQVLSVLDSATPERVPSARYRSFSRPPAVQPLCPPAECFIRSVCSLASHTSLRGGRRALTLNPCSNILRPVRTAALSIPGSVAPWGRV